MDQPPSEGKLSVLVPTSEAALVFISSVQRLLVPAIGVGSSQCALSPEVSVIHDFLLKSVKPFTAFGSPGAGGFDHPRAQSAIAHINSS